MTIPQLSIATAALVAAIAALTRAGFPPMVTALLIICAASLATSLTRGARR